MRALSFTLQGETAFFKKPDVNTFMYFTYGNIHKVALLGLFGAIMGYSGYGAQKVTDTYPEFYEKLKDLNVAIVPQAKKTQDIPGIFGKKVQTFNNSVGYASGEAGGNLIVKEQWLEKPCWKIFIKETHPVYELLKNRLLNRQYVYIPYLGKNDHLANIIEVKEVEIEEIQGSQIFNSLCLKRDFEWVEEEEEEDDFYEETVAFYKYEEKLPIALEPEHNQYEVESFILTNKKLKYTGGQKVYRTSEKENIYFI